jgi:predicted alpha/beta-hydrolase family hydrolase
MEEVSIPVGESEVTASVHGAGDTVLVLGHGAGGTRRQPVLTRLADALAATGRAVVLYNFPYSEKRRKVPDAPAVLESAARAVFAHARRSLSPRRLVVGGKSMGGRIASQVVAQGEPADGLVFLGYPLHPPGKPDVLRDRHLPAITAPMLFIQGTRDAFARPDLLAAVLARLGDRAVLHPIEGGDHSFAVPKAAGRPAAAVEAEVAAAAVEWLNARGL